MVYCVFGHSIQQGLRCGIKVEWSKQGLPHRSCCGIGCRAEEVQCELRLGDKEVPMVGRKRWRYSSKYCKKVILEGTDGSFCRIASMEMWRDELESAFVGGNGTLEG